MAEPDPKTDPKKDDPDPDAGAKKALDAERKLRREAEQHAKDLEQRIAKLEENGKSASDKDRDESKKLNDTVEQLQKDLADERVMRLKAEVAASKGLSGAQAKRLTGTTREELESDADDLLEAFPAASKDDGKETPRGGPPSARPRPALSGGNEPAEKPVETDPAKLAEDVPRL